MIKKKLKVPAYTTAGAVGAVTSAAKQGEERIKAMMNAGIQGFDAMSQSFIQAQQPTTSTKQANLSTLSNITSGAAKGAQIGSAFGPFGTAAGAVVGAIPGIIGHSAKVTNPLGFTEEAYISDYGSGLFARRGRAKRKRNRINAAVRENVVAGQNTARLEEEWAEQDSSDTYSFEEGGKAPYTLAYVDDGELINTPDGNITKVPEENKPTDSNLVNLPGGSRILSDKLKVPGTNKTFAQLGEEFMSKKQSKGTDRYAENSRMLNDRNNKLIYDQLFDIQEKLKEAKGIKPKTKSMNIPAAVYGDDIDDDIYDGGSLSEVTVTAPTTDPFEVHKKMLKKFGALSTVPPSYINTVPDLKLDKVKSGMESLRQKGLKELERKQQEYDAKADRNARIANLASKIGSMLGKVGELSPALANMFPGEAESVTPKYNPYEKAIMNRMSRRRYNIEPTKRALVENRAISDYNASRQNTSTGQNLAYRLQSASQLNKSIADLYAQASMIQNSYDKDYADAANAIGQQRVAADNLASEINAQNRAAMRNIRRQGYSDFSNWLQRNRQERNMSARDRAMLDIYKPFLESGTESKYLDQLYSLFR